MALVPHDVTELGLAPASLAVEQFLLGFSGLGPGQVRARLERTRTTGNREQRQEAVVRALLDEVELHGWEPGWSERGLRLTHGQFSVDLGLPAGLRDYLDGA